MDQENNPLSRFELNGVEEKGREIGRGSYAVVEELDFRGLSCVGKSIHEELYDNASDRERVDMLARFGAECELLSQVRHPHVVQFVGVHFKQGSRLPVLVIERLDSTLSDCLDRYGKLPDEVSYPIIRDVAVGLCYLHGYVPNPIVHRDLTANNVLLTSDMKAKISDLGVAKMLNLNPARMAQMTTCPGTPSYMPPEALVTRPIYNTKVDTFSYGNLMTHVFSGVWPIPTPAFRVDPSNPNIMIPATEVERRQEYLQDLGDTHPLIVLTRQCLSNNPFNRPEALDILARINQVMPQFPPSFQNKVEVLQQIESDHNEKRSLTSQIEKHQQQTAECQKQIKEKDRQIVQLEMSCSLEREGMRTRMSELQRDIESLKMTIKAQQQHVQAAQASQQELSTTQQLLKAKDELLAAKDQQLSAKDQQLAAKGQQVQAKQHEVQAKIQELLSQAQELSAKDRELNAQRSEISALREVVANKETHESNMMNIRSQVSQVHRSLSKGCRVQLDTFSEAGPPQPRYGVIRWIGEVTGVMGTIAGIEMEEHMEGCTDGTFQMTGQKLFDCPDGRGLYFPLAHLRPDKRFTDPRIANSLVRYPLEERAYQNIMANQMEKYLGDERGIQGHQNSCYLDATVFGLFALSDDFDSMFLTEAKDAAAKEISDILWKGIINPLRKNGIVRHESVMQLRNKLEEFGKMKGVNQDEEDPEEFLNLLFKHIFSVEPFVYIRRPYGEEPEYFVQLFVDCDESLKLPTVGVLLKKMFREQDITFTQVPSRLLIQVPRFGKQYKTYQKIIPADKLNVADLLTTPYQCFNCEKTAWKQCSACAKEYTSERRAVNGRIHFCDSCAKLVHTHKSRSNHCVQQIAPPPEVADVSELELLSVICIETSHYVCFTRAENRWIFFDSMANRVYEMYNIPKGVDCTQELNEWVYFGDHQRLLDTPPRELPEYVRRFTQDIYMCVYVNHDVGMYT